MPITKDLSVKMNKRSIESGNSEWQRIFFLFYFVFSFFYYDGIQEWWYFWTWKPKRRLCDIKVLTPLNPVCWCWMILLCWCWMILLCLCWSAQEWYLWTWWPWDINVILRCQYHLIMCEWCLFGYANVLESDTFELEDQGRQCETKVPTPLN